MLLPMRDERWIPKNYRPIACLPTIFNVLTSIIIDRLYKHLEDQDILESKEVARKTAMDTVDYL